MLHTASLIHDDVVDEAFVRRGAPSVNALWRSHTAVLIGDYIFARTYHVCMEQGATTCSPKRPVPVRTR
ncbi:MAG: polyprenyl synthetase family protein [Alistipes indistinctus]